MHMYAMTYTCVPYTSVNKGPSSFATRPPGATNASPRCDELTVASAGWSVKVCTLGGAVINAARSDTCPTGFLHVVPNNAVSGSVSLGVLGLEPAR